MKTKTKKVKLKYSYEQVSVNAIDVFVDEDGEKVRMCSVDRDADYLKGIDFDRAQLIVDALNKIDPY